MLSVLLALLEKIIPAISPEIRAQIQAHLQDLKIKAAATANPLDDIFVAFLIAIVG